MIQIVECVSNFSVVRRVQVVDEIARAIRAKGAEVLVRQVDADHNRAVITFAGEPSAAE